MPAAQPSDRFPGPLLYWALAYSFLVIVGVIVVFLTRTTTTYHVAVSASIYRHDRNDHWTVD